jgi:multiple sugar transport system substrate-binding protein
MNTTEHPDEAFTVLTYLLDEAVPILTATYGAYPARPEYQQPYIDGLNEQYPFGVNWDVAIESLNYTASPNHEADFPNFTKGFDRMNAFQSLLESDAGADINLDEEFDLLEADLQAILDEVQ